MLRDKLRYGVLLVLGFTLNSYALVPLEGIVLGKVKESLQTDPLQNIFLTAPREGNSYEWFHYKNYILHINEAQELERSCNYIGEASYVSPQDEIIARRTMVATLQYIGLDLTVNMIGRYARFLNMPENEYNVLVERLVQSSCSPNLSVYSLKLIKHNLYAVFNKKENIQLLDFVGEPFAPVETLRKVSSVDTRENEFNHITKNFRALCSWGGEVDNYRLLPPLLSNPVVMSRVIQHMLGANIKFDEKRKSVSLEFTPGLQRVSCAGPLCRADSTEKFEKNFPRMVGSSGLKQDLQRQWCGHFRYQNYLTNERQAPTIRQWIKEQEPEDERKDVSVMVSLFTGVSDLVMAAKSYNELSEILRHPIESRWNQWANRSIENFSVDLYREEPLEFRVQKLSYQTEKMPFQIDLTVTMGELDRVLALNDKLKFEFGAKFSRNWLRWIRTQAIEARLGDNPAEGLERVIGLTAAHLKKNPIDKFSEGFAYFGDLGPLSGLLAETLIDQLLMYEGNYFDDLQEKMVRIPIRLHYGMFALSYIKHKLRIIRNPSIVVPGLDYPVSNSVQENDIPPT